MMQHVCIQSKGSMDKNWCWPGTILKFRLKNLCITWYKPRASNLRPAGQKWPAKGFKMAHQRFLGWLVDWCFRADVVSCRKIPQNPSFKTPIKSEWRLFFWAFIYFLAENTDEIWAKTFFFFFGLHTINFGSPNFWKQQIWPAAEKGWMPMV